MDNQSAENLVYTVVAAATLVAAGLLVVKFIDAPSFVSAPIELVMSVPDVFAAVGGFLWNHLFWVVIGVGVLITMSEDE